MKWNFREWVSRLAKAGLCIFLGVVLCWRALNYSSTLDTSMLAPTLCVSLALVLAITGVAVAMRASDLDTAPEQTPARQN